MSSLSMTENPPVRSNPSVLTEFTKVRDLIKREKNVLSLSQPASFTLDLKTSTSQPNRILSPQNSMEYFSTHQVQQAKAISTYFQRDDLKIATIDAYQQEDDDFKRRARCQSIEQLESQWNTIKKQCKFNSRGNSPTNQPEKLNGPNSVRGCFELKNLREARQTSQEQRQLSKDEDNKALRLFLRSIKQKNRSNTGDMNVLETSIKLQDSKDVSQTDTVSQKGKALVKKISHLMVKVSPRITGRDGQVQEQVAQRIEKDLSSQRNASHRLEKGFDKKWFTQETKNKAQEVNMSSGLWGDIFSSSKNGESNHNNSNAAISDTTVGSQRVFVASVKSQVSVKADFEIPQHFEQASKTGDKASIASSARNEDKETKKEGNGIKKEMVKIIRVIENPTSKRETRSMKKNDTSKKKIVQEDQDKDQDKDASASISLLLTDSKSRASSANSKRFPESKISERAKSLLRCIRKDDNQNSLISSSLTSIVGQSGTQTPTKVKPSLIPQLGTIKEIRKHKSNTKGKAKKEDCSQDVDNHKTEPKKQRQLGLTLTIAGVTEIKRSHFTSPKKSSTMEFTEIGSIDKNYVAREKSPASVGEENHASNPKTKPQEKLANTEKLQISIKENGAQDAKEKRANPRSIQVHIEEHGLRKAESLHMDKIKMQRPATENHTPKTIKCSANTGPTDEINTLMNINSSSKASTRVDALRSQLREKNKESRFKPRAQGQSKNEDSKVKHVINLK